MSLMKEKLHRRHAKNSMRAQGSSTVYQKNKTEQNRRKKEKEKRKKLAVVTIE